MKNLTILFIPLLYSLSAPCQPEWAPTGVKWGYITTDGFNVLDERIYESVGEETFSGKLCRVVQKSTTTYYTYEENGQVFIYNPIDSSFQVRFDFNVQTGDSWQFTNETGSLLTAHVDSTATKNFGGLPYQVQYVRVTDPALPCCDFTEEVIVGLGSTERFLLPFVTDLTIEFSFGLACYFSEDTGVLGIVEFPNLDIDCNDLYTSSVNLDFNVSPISLSPNPARGQVTIEMPQPLTTDSRWSLYSATGQRVLSQELEKGHLRYNVPLAGLPPGLYFWEVRSEGRQVGSGKLVVSP